MVCSYCQQENDPYKEICSFCEAPLNAARPDLNRNVSEDDFGMPFPILVTYHTYHLLLLLKNVRAERSKMYNLMRRLQRAPEEVAVDSESIGFAESEYRAYTARMKVLEGILIDRMGYKPYRVDEKLLQALEAKIERHPKK